MGWYYTHGASRKDIIRELTVSGDSHVERWCLVGNTLWTVESREGQRWIIGCFLLTRGSGDGWGYKPMDEGSHPYQYSCPLAYLDAVPVACEEWRRRVRKYQAEKLPRLRAGMRVELKSAGFPGAFTLTRKNRRGWEATGPDGFGAYLLRPGVVARVVSSGEVK